MKKIMIAAALAVAAIAGWYFGSPYYTLHQMKGAAEARDGAKLAAYIDFPALRESFKAEVRRGILAEAAKEPQNEMSGVGTAFAMAFLGPMVDAMVTPEAMEAMFDAQRAKETAAGKGAKLPGFTPAEDPKIEHRGFDEFRVPAKDGEGAMIFRRDGLGWKLSGISLPAKH